MVACNTWGHELSAKKVMFHCDNISVVYAVNAGTSKCNHLMGLIRDLYFVAAKGNFDVRLQHVPGVLNIAADLLSRGRINRYLTLFPEANRTPTPAGTGSTDRWYI